LTRVLAKKSRLILKFFFRGSERKKLVEQKISEKSKAPLSTTPSEFETPLFLSLSVSFNSPR